MKSSDLWFAIVDGEHARLVSIENHGGIGHPRFVRGAPVAPDGYRHPPAVRTHWWVDAVAPTNGSQSTKVSFKRPKTSERFIEMVAEHMDRQCADVNALILVAKPEVARQLQRRIRKDIRAKIVSTSAKNLCNVPEHELLSHLNEIQRGSR